MHIQPFAVEIWMNEWENRCEYNLAETCVQSLTIEELLKISGKDATELSALLPMKMTYGDITGSPRLRTAVSTLYTKQSADNVMITHGTIGANALVHKAIVSAGDKVVSVVPAYQQHYSIPASIGAEMHYLRLEEKDNYLPDLQQLRDLVTSGTRLIALTNPNNPTGALIEQPMLEEIADIARAVDAWVLCDEVYRGTDQEGTGLSASIADVYEKGISTGSTSKAFSLAGLRVGWVTACAEVMEAVSIHRDYDTISISLIDDYFAALALENKAPILARSRAITSGNLALLEAWVNNEPLISWVRPSSGTTALLRYDLPIDSNELCVAILRETGVLFTPGAALDMEGTLRIGYANAPEILRQGLARVSDYLASAGQQAAAV